MGGWVAGTDLEADGDSFCGEAPADQLVFVLGGAEDVLAWVGRSGGGGGGMNE